MVRAGSTRSVPSRSAGRGSDWLDVLDLPATDLWSYGSGTPAAPLRRGGRATTGARPRAEPLKLPAGLLPGVLMRNARLKFICHDVHLRVERSDTPFTRGYNAGQIIRVPVAHGEGNYEADEETLKRLESEGRVLYRYCSADGVVDENSNINGAANSIAGIVNERGNVLGMMPHPENHVEDIMGCTDGRGLFAGLVAHLEKAA